MELFIILFSILGAIETFFKPRFDFTEEYIFLWYNNKKGYRDFVRFSKLK